MRLTTRDTVTVLETVKTLNAHRDAGTFPHAALAAVRALIPADHYGYNELNLRTRRMTALVEPDDAVPVEIESLARLMREHPLFAHIRQTGDRAAHAISELIAPRDFHRLTVYDVFFRPSSIEDQVACILPGPPWLVVALVASRGRPAFTERDRLVLDLLRPHVEQAYRACQALALYAEAGDMQERATVLLEDGVVQAASERAFAWLARYADWDAERRALPEPLAGWVREQLARPDVDHLPSSRRAPLVVEQGGMVLEFQLVRSHHPEQCLLVLEERLVELDPRRLSELDLSTREAEVLRLVALRLSNEAIADRLSISPRTVGKHLEHVYDRLGVSSRQEAVAVARERLRAGGPRSGSAAADRRVGWRSGTLAGLPEHRREPRADLPGAYPLPTRKPG
ncbi:MAG TPA: helix-turn-helix transcriptional regulator [Actinospica sp.]|nr:helix-turn-helix transcriptional regulator [Actinospica sp.]